MIDLKLVKIADLVALIFHNMSNYHNNNNNLNSILQLSKLFLCFASDSKTQFAQICNEKQLAFL